MGTYENSVHPFLVLFYNNFCAWAVNCSHVVPIPINICLLGTCYIIVYKVYQFKKITKNYVVIIANHKAANFFHAWQSPLLSNSLLIIIKILRISALAAWNVRTWHHPHCSFIGETVIGRFFFFSSTFSFIIVLQVLNILWWW